MRPDLSGGSGGFDIPSLDARTLGVTPVRDVSEKPIRFLMLGGFLGAGKTTAIARLARHYLSSGRQVGLVTNDQAYDLVDTQTLRAMGFQVGEVPGACFCCKFDELVETVSRLHDQQVPDVVIAEPVGSCTDLVATVIEPLRRYCGDRYEVGPLAVLVKPEHGQKILGGLRAGGYSPKAAYIFQKQIEEADLVVINKTDKLSDHQRAELADVVRRRFPDKQVLAISARRGDGFEQLIEHLERPGEVHGEFMDVDYDIYAEGEAELGWLNCVVQLSSDSGSFAVDDVVRDLVGHLKEGLAAIDAEPAHLKVSGHGGDGMAVANLVAAGDAVELSRAADQMAEAAELTVNARVVVDPAVLEDVVRQAVDELSRPSGLNASVVRMQRFRPGRPVPTHRMQ